MKSGEWRKLQSWRLRFCNSPESRNRLIDYPPADMTITVEAGMTIGDLQRQLAEKRQWLPVDVAHPDRATVGGAIARTPPARADTPTARCATICWASRRSMGQG